MLYMEADFSFLLAHCACGADIATGRWIALMAAYCGFQRVSLDYPHPGNQSVAAFHGLFDRHIVMRGDACRLATAACSAFVRSNANVFSHLHFPLCQHARPKGLSHVRR